MTSPSHPPAPMLLVVPAALANRSAKRAVRLHDAWVPGRHGIILAGIMGAAMFGAGCQSEPLPPPAQIEQWSGALGGESTAAVESLRTAAQWDAFWQKVGWYKPRALEPAREMGVAIHLGERRTGGYAAKVIAAAPAGGRVNIEYREVTPEPGRLYTRAPTTPWVVAVVPLSNQPVIARNAASGEMIAAAAAE